MIDRSQACLICPFTCKGASECKPRLLVNELRNYLPSVLNISTDNDNDKYKALEKPNITLKIDICGREYRI